MMKLSDYVFKFISELGVRHVFLLPGGGSMHLVDSLGKRSDLQPVCCLHEQAVSIAADAYSQYTNHIGVSLVTTGPGGTNAITGVAASWLDSIPQLVISGQVKRADSMVNKGVRQMGIQEVDILSIVKSITKYAVTIVDPMTIRFHLEKAVYLAQTGRKGPVWVDIPLDVQGSLIEEKSLQAFSPEIASDERSIVRNQAAETIRLINESERPVILAGNGIRLSRATDEFLDLVERLAIPVLTTWKAIDLLPDSHDLFFGRPGTIGQRGANFVQQNADLIMTIGARLDLAQIGYNHDHFAPHATKVIVDIDAAEIKKMKTNITLAVACDAKIFINEVAKESVSLIQKNRSAWLARCHDWKKKYPVVIPEYWNGEKYVNTYVLVDVLSELLTGGDVLVPGSSGGCSEITLQAFRVKNGQRILNSPGLGSMGFGLPASIGAAAASGKRTITIIGDGGLQHNIQELETIARLNLPIKVFILNNNGYASIRNTQKNHFKGHYVCCDPESGLTFPDTSKIASAYGIPFVKIINHQVIRDQIKSVLESGQPVICEVMVDPFLATAPKLASEVRPDGSIVSKPLEDLWPFLEREEFYSNMIVSASKKG
ncbi:MAG: thiamine pyrophosphate-binding protein [Deltaproteobacteria bacterium]|nr:thiamine pyrophosphate-binding protein [Deltaproteobacteria bacterium]